MNININKEKIVEYYKILNREILNEEDIKLGKVLTKHNFICGEEMKLLFVNQKIFNLKRTCSFSSASLVIMRKNLDIFVALLQKNLFFQYLNNKILPEELLEWQNLFYMSHRRKNCVLLPILILIDYLC